MPDYLLAFSFFIGLFILELVYFRIAFTHKIVDKPNQRSSHKKLTIRGGGVIFPVAVLLWWILSGFEFPWFVAGLVLISVVSFIDDLDHIDSRIRFFFQFLAIVLVLMQFDISLPWFWYPILVIIAIGTKNAWNFMDGINGITGGYSLVTIGCLYYINQYVHPFTNGQLIIAIGIALLVFNFFNFRKKAVCFAGDVGSVSLAFIIIFLILQLILVSQNLIFVGLILLYGLDTVTTIIFRLIRRENVFEAHRSHFYQFLVNEQQWPHLIVSSFYAVIQILIDLVIITQFSFLGNYETSAIELSLLLVVSAGTFLIIRFSLEGSEHLIVRKNGTVSQISK